MSSPPPDAAEPADKAPREGRATAALYAVTLVAYIAIGYLTKSVVLNWVVGPLFPLLVLYLLPRVADMVRGRSAARP